MFCNMKILTWNINGIRATKVPLKALFDRLDADVICFQETKVTRDQLDEASAIVDGYNSYFSFSKVRNGYSGVATFVRDSATPIRAEEGLTGILAQSDDTCIGCHGSHSDFTAEELNALDREGRSMITQHRILTADGEPRLMTVINVYCPHVDPDNKDRLSYKLNFYRLLQARAEALLPHSHVVIVGDVNTSHKRIDHCDPDSTMEFDKNPGRMWLSQFLAEDTSVTDQKSAEVDEEMLCKERDVSAKFVDTFRYFHPSRRDSFTCWRTTTGARATNYGTRIDYIFADIPLVTTAFTECEIRPDVDGSDHCPVVATIDVACLPSSGCPKLCTKYMPEFAGRQQKLLTYFSKKDRMGRATGNGIEGGINVDNVNGLTSSIDCNAEKCTDDRDAPGITSSSHIRLVVSDANKRSSTTRIVPKRKAPSDRKNLRPVKQGNLLNFFNKPVRQPSETCADCVMPSIESNGNNNEDSEKSYHLRPCLAAEMNWDIACFQQTVSDGTICSQDVKNDESSSASTWKTLLSGPPVSPLCRGHKEACVLRTVKKDGPNKGRQFWVCARPDGHRTNRAARCEHFEWITKKR